MKMERVASLESVLIHLKVHFHAIPFKSKHLRNEFHFSEVYPSVNYIGLHAK